MNTEKVVEGHKYFESQEADEKVILIVRKHWTILLIPFFIGFVILAVALTLSALIRNAIPEVFDGNGDTILACVLSIIILYDLLYMFLSWLIRYLNVAILTGEHLVDIEQPSLFSRKVSELDLDCIEDASAAQRGIFQTTLKYGEVIVQTAGELPNFVFKGICDPYEISQKIMEVKEAYMKESRIVINGGANNVSSEITADNISGTDQLNKNEPKME